MPDAALHNHPGPFFVVIRTATPLAAIGSSGIAAGIGLGRYDHATDAIARRDSVRRDGVDAVITVEL